MTTNKNMHLRLGVIVLLQVVGLAALFFHFRKIFQEVIEDSPPQTAQEMSTTSHETHGSVQNSAQTSDATSSSVGAQTDTAQEAGSAASPGFKSDNSHASGQEARLEPSQAPVLRGLLARFKSNSQGGLPQGNLSTMLANLQAAGLPTQPRQEGHPSTGVRLRLFAQAHREAQPLPFISSYSAALSMPAEAKDAIPEGLQDLDLIREDLVFMPAAGQSAIDLFRALEADLSRECGPATSGHETREGAVSADTSAERRFARWNAEGGYHMWLYVESNEDALRRVERDRTDGLREETPGAPPPGVRLTLEAEIH